MSNLARRSLLATEALDARDGASLFRYTSSTPVAFAAAKLEKDGTALVRGVDVLKVGTYKGLSLGSFELEGMAARHRELRDGGVFLPPFRLDHSFSVMSVIGWCEELFTEAAVDPITGAETLYLRTDVRFTGSLDYTPAQILEAIKTGALRNRSSELGPYVTNQGVELPLVFYGAAFVDVPAVEGLAPIALSRITHAGPAAVTELSEGDAVQDDEETPVDETPAETPEVDDEENDDAVPPVEPVTPPLEPGEATDLERDAARQDLDGHVDDVVLAAPSSTSAPDGTTVTLPEDVEDNSEDGDPLPDAPPAPVDEPVDEPAPVDTPEPETPAETATLRADGDDELARLRAENLRLRTDQLRTDLAAFDAAGVLVPLNRPAATVLLSHEDETVREATRTLLSGVPTLAALNTVHGRQNLSAALSAAESTHASPAAGHIALGMAAEEVGALWASLTPEQRRERQPELNAWEKARRDAASH